MARMYERPVCGVWIEGEHWQECLPKGSVELTAPIDARQRDDPVLFEEIARALERVGLDSRDTGMTAPAMGAIPLASQPAVPTEMALSTNPSKLPTELVTLQDQITDVSPPPGHSLEPTADAAPLPAVLPLPPKPTSTGHGRGISEITAGMLIGLAVLVIAGGMLGTLSLLTHFGVIGTRSGVTTATVVRGRMPLQTQLRSFPMAISITRFRVWSIRRCICRFSMVTRKACFILARRPRFPPCRMEASARTPKRGHSI